MPCIGGNAPAASFEYIFRITPICFMLFEQLDRRAASRARARAGSRIAARMPMIAITTRSSMRVKPHFVFRMAALLVNWLDIHEKYSPASRRCLEVFIYNP